MQTPELERKQKSKTAEASRVLRSSELFLGSREVVIEHNSGLYRLMITKAGKLILNK